MEPVQTSAAGGVMGKPDQGTSGGNGGISTPAWPTVSEATASLFTWFNTDGDDIIAVDEIIGVLDPQGHHGDQLNAVVRRVVELIDTDTGPDETVQLTVAEVAAAMASLDSNRDGSLSPADLVPELAQQGLAPLLAVMLQGGPLPGSGRGEATTARTTCATRATRTSCSAGTSCTAQAAQATGTTGAPCAAAASGTTRRPESDHGGTGCRRAARPLRRGR